MNISNWIIHGKLNCVTGDSKKYIVKLMLTKWVKKVRSTRINPIQSIRSTFIINTCHASQCLFFYSWTMFSFFYFNNLIVTPFVHLSDAWWDEWVVRVIVYSFLFFLLSFLFAMNKDVLFFNEQSKPLKQSTIKCMEIWFSNN